MRCGLRDGPPGRKKHTVGGHPIITTDYHGLSNLGTKRGGDRSDHTWTTANVNESGDKFILPGDRYRMGMSTSPENTLYLGISSLPRITTVPKYGPISCVDRGGDICDRSGGCFRMFHRASVGSLRHRSDIGLLQPGEHISGVPLIQSFIVGTKHRAVHNPARVRQPHDAPQVDPLESPALRLG